MYDKFNIYFVICLRMLSVARLQTCSAHQINVNVDHFWIYK